jgi:CRISPR/Cas system CMR-associated protein Cmr1 (group 7 of RAMP superfamily)
MPTPKKSIMGKGESPVSVGARAGSRASKGKVIKIQPKANTKAEPKSNVKVRPVSNTVKELREALKPERKYYESEYNLPKKRPTKRITGK